MRKLLCKITYMKYYRGTSNDDQPANGGSFVKENGYGHEEYNFDPVNIDGREKPVCLGFFETKSTRGKINQLHIEKLEGCELLKNEERADDVLVIWCATPRDGIPKIVGWYKHASVYRHYQECDFDNGYVQYYNIIADAENCFLLPHTMRGAMEWRAPNAKDHGFGFGQAMQLFANDERSEEYMNRLFEQIESYNGESVADQMR